jgi:hypothetical protein
MVEFIKNVGQRNSMPTGWGLTGRDGQPRQDSSGTEIRYLKRVFFAKPSDAARRDLVVDVTRLVDTVSLHHGDDSVKARKARRISGGRRLMEKAVAILCNCNRKSVTTKGASQSGRCPKSRKGYHSL